MLSPRFPHPRAGYRSAQDLNFILSFSQGALAPQTAEQLVEVPRLCAFLFLVVEVVDRVQQRFVEQISLTFQFRVVEGSTDLGLLLHPGALLMPWMRLIPFFLHFSQSQKSAEVALQTRVARHHDGWFCWFDAPHCVPLFVGRPSLDCWEISYSAQCLVRQWIHICGSLRSCTPEECRYAVFLGEYFQMSYSTLLGSTVDTCYFPVYDGFCTNFLLFLRGFTRILRSILVLPSAVFSLSLLRTRFEE